MSKVVKRIGNFVKKVVKGVVKVVKKVWDNPIGRILIIAVASMVVGPMVGALANGASFSAAWAAGVGNLTSTITGMGSSLAAGNFAEAGSQLMSGLSWSNVPADAAQAANLGAEWSAELAAAQAAPNGALDATGLQETIAGSTSGGDTVLDAMAGIPKDTASVMEATVGDGIANAGSAASSAAPAASATPTASLDGFVTKPIWEQAGTGVMDKMIGNPIAGATSPVANIGSTGNVGNTGGNWFTKMMGSKYGSQAAVYMGGQLISGIGSGLQQEAMLDEEERRYNRELNRRNTNQSVGNVNLWG